MIVDPDHSLPLAEASVAALIASRICHDLINPIGAIGNGVELLTLSGKGAGPELDLIGESVSRAQARIRFFRIAFGEFSAEQRISPAEVRSILKALFAGTRVEMAWNITDDLPRREAKLCFLLMLCLETALPRGGKVSAEADRSGWRLAARADRFQLDPDIWAGLSTGRFTCQLTPTLVQFALAARHNQVLGGRIGTEFGSGSAIIAFSCD